MRALASPGKRGAVPVSAGTKFLRAALRGQPFPPEILNIALTRLLLPQEKKSDQNALTSIIKAVLRRSARYSQMTQEVGMQLDKECSQVPYLLGLRISPKEEAAT